MEFFIASYVVTTSQVYVYNQNASSTEHTVKTFLLSDPCEDDQKGFKRNENLFAIQIPKIEQKVWPSLISFVPLHPYTSTLIQVQPNHVTGRNRKYLETILFRSVRRTT